MPPVPAAVDSAIDVAKMFTAIMTTRAGTICASINNAPGTQLKPRDLRVLKDASERNIAESGARAVLLICIHALGLRLASIKHRMDTTPGADLPSVDHRTGTLLEHLLRLRNDLDGKPRIPTAREALRAVAAASSRRLNPAILNEAPSSARSEESILTPACGATPQRCDADPALEARARRAARDLRRAQRHAAFKARCAARTAAARTERAKQLEQAAAARAEQAARSRAAQPARAAS